MKMQKILKALKLDLVMKKLNIKMKKSRFRALVGKGEMGKEKFLLVKPQTFMNLSGTALRGLARFYKVDPSKELIVIYDDTDLDAGKIRIRKKGSAGGHNGMKSIIANVGTEEFARVRIGIGKRSEEAEMVDFVLGRFTNAERKVIDEGIEKAAEAVIDILENGIDHAMNHFN